MSSLPNQLRVPIEVEHLLDVNALLHRSVDAEFLECIPQIFAQVAILREFRERGLNCLLVDLLDDVVQFLLRQARAFEGPLVQTAASPSSTSAAIASASVIASSHSSV